MPDKNQPKFNKSEDGTITFELSIPWHDVQEAYNKSLKETKKKVELKGFRVGKAPDKLVEDHIGKQKLYSLSLKQLLPNFYVSKIKELGLKPITSPRIEPGKIQEGKDWFMQVTVAEKPDVQLGDYKKIVLDTKVSSNLWVPGQSSQQANPSKSSSDKSKSDNAGERLSKIFSSLIEMIHFSLPSFLIEEQLNHDLSHLLDQLQRLGLSLDQYLISLGKTIEQLKKEYRQQAERSLRLEFILNEISQDLKITVFEEEVDQLINSLGDENIKENLRKSSVDRASIRESIRKRKTTDELLKL